MNIVARARPDIAWASARVGPGLATPLLNVELKNAVSTYLGAIYLVEKMIYWSFFRYFLAIFGFLNFISLTCLNWACGHRCYLKKHFNLSWSKVITSSKKGFGLLSAADVSCWRLVCVAKVGEWFLIDMGVITDEQIMTSTKPWSVTRIAVNCTLMVLINRSFKQRYVIFVF